MSDENIKLQPFNYKTLTFLEWMREIETNELFEGKPAWIKILLAGRADILASYIDARANNNMFHSMFTKQNVYNFAWYLDFYPPPPGCATGSILVNLAPDTALPVTIPKEKLVFLTADIVGDKPVSYTALADHTFTELTGLVSVREGQLFTDVQAYLTTGGEFEEFIIDRNNFVKGLSTISIGGLLWEETDRFFDSISTDRHYRVIFHYDGYVKIRSGDGAYGARFPIGENPIVTGWYGGGTRGNQGVGKVNVYGGNHPAILSVTNPARMTGGTGEMSLERIKTLAPLFVQAQDRIVSKDDFLAFSLSFPSISRVFVQPNYYGVLSTRVQAVPAGGGTIPSSLRQSLEGFLKNKTLLSGIYVIVVTPNYEPQDVSIELRLRDGITFAEVEPWASLAIRVSVSEVLAELKETLLAEGREALVEYINSLWGYTFDSGDEETLRLISDIVTKATVLGWGEKLYPNKFYGTLDLISMIAGVNVIEPSGIVTPSADGLINMGNLVLTEEDKPERTLVENIGLSTHASISLSFEDQANQSGVGFSDACYSEVV